MDIVKELMEYDFHFESKTGYPHTDPKVTRYLVFNRYKDNISIVGYMSFNAYDETVTYKMTRVDMTGAADVTTKEVKNSNVPVAKAKETIIDLIKDNKILLV